MTERIVKTTLQVVVANYVAGMDKAAKATALTTTEAQRLAAQGAAFTTLGTTALRMGVVVATGLAIAIVRFAEFDQAMSQVQAATQASADDMDLLRDAALEAGASTVYTAKEAANAIEELGKAGLTTAQIIGGGLKGALTLAAAGGLEVADAATFMATSLKQFNRDGDEASHVADLLAAGAGKAVGDVNDLAQALNQAGLIANGAGFSIEETTGVLAAFADAGLLGSDAGTSLKTAIVALQAPTGKAAALLEKYKINVYDANGEMLGFAGIAGQLETKLGDLDDQTRNAALATIFGTDALRSANVLYAQGAAGIQKYIDQTNDSGYAAKVAADRLNDLAGDVEKLGGAFDTALIKNGSTANDTLRQLVQSATFLVGAVGHVPEPLMAVGMAFGVVTVAMLLTGGAALVTIPKFAALKATVEASRVSMGTFALRTAAVGGALGVATLLVGLFIAKQAQASASADEFAASLDETTGALTDYSRELIAKKLADTNAFETAEKAGVSQKELTAALYKGGDAYAAVIEKLDEFNRKSGPEGGAAQNGILLRNNIGQLNSEINTGKERFKDIAAATDGAAQSTQTAAEKYKEAADNAQALNDELHSLIDTMNKSNDVGQDAVSTNAAYQKTITDVATYVAAARKGVEGYALGLDESTVAGAANADMLRGLASDSQSAAEAQLALDGNTKTYLVSVSNGRQTIIDNAIALGATADQAQDLADKIYAIPTAAEVQVIAETATATKKIQDFKALLAMPQVVITPQIRAAGGYYANRATGGAITGPGTGTSDQAGLFRLSNGEHVLTAADVDAMGGQSGVYSFRRSLYRGYADGGAVQYAPQSSGGSGGGTTKVINQTNYLQDSGAASEVASARLRASLAGL